MSAKPTRSWRSSRARIPASGRISCHTSADSHAQAPAQSAIRNPHEHVVVTQVLLITGGSRGIGAATARLAAERGYAVCVNYRANQEAANGVVSDIERTGGRAIAAAADVSV